MTDTPERIWAEPPDVFEGMGFWRSACEGIGTEYLRADLAARREADAYRAGWEFAFRQWQATGSVPDPDYKPEGGSDGWRTDA